MYLSFQPKATEAVKIPAYKIKESTEAISTPLSPSRPLPSFLSEVLGVEIGLTRLASTLYFPGPFKILIFFLRKDLTL